MYVIECGYPHRTIFLRRSDSPVGVGGFGIARSKGSQLELDGLEKSGTRGSNERGSYSSASWASKIDTPHGAVNSLTGRFPVFTVPAGSKHSTYASSAAEVRCSTP